MMLLGTKIQIAVIVLVLIAAGFLFFRNSRQSIDLSVNSWTLYRPHPKDKSKPLSVANPEDPKLRELVNGFGCVDGVLEIIEYPNDPSRHPTLVFKPETKGGKREYHFFQDPLSPVASIKDSVRHALALSTYHLIYEHQSLGFLNGVNLMPDQATKESDARESLNLSITNIDTAISTGTYHPELMDKVMKALTVYKAKSGDPSKDATKAELARHVLEAATIYLNRIQVDKDKVIDRYLDAVAGILTPTQQTKLASAAQTYEQSQQAKPRVTRAPQRNSTTNTAGRSSRGVVTSQAGG